ncbi:MAG: AAS bifunctional protein [Desulfuromonas sp. SDB]|nr:MAG: AAS bifunctional protein [Desulfuromonas sp. SDB]
MESITKTDKLLAALKANLPAAILNKQVYHSSEDDLAVILFTSGSEKDPKAVGLSHKNIISNIQAAVEHVGLLPEDVFIGILPYFHVFGFNTNLFVPLLTGSSLVTYPNPLDYKKVTNIIKNENITILIGTPSFLSGYIKQADVGDFKSLRLAISGADKTPEWLFKEYKQKHDVILLEGYGSTETSPIISINQPDNYKIGSIGKPLKNINVKIESVDSSELLSEEKVGKILVKGDSIFTGYFDDLEETSFRIRDGWYDTGDMGSLDKDGFLWHKGRLRRFVKIGGEMISLVNVESILEKYLPDNVECCVIEIPDTRKGSKIIAVTSENIDKIEILKKLKNNLPNIALPKNFVTLENLPKMGSGKIDFRTITEMVKNLSYHQQ